MVDVLRQGAKVGQPIILFRTSNSDPARRLRPSPSRARRPTSSRPAWCPPRWPALRLHRRLLPTAREFPLNDPAFELEYAPFGVDSGLCMGVAATAVPERGRHACSRVACPPRPSGSWTADSHTTRSGAYVPLINGSNTNFSHPFVLTYPNNGFPTDKPRPQLLVRNLTGFSHGIGTLIGSVDNNQLWSADFGVLK